MRFLVDSAKKDLRWRFTDPSALLISIFIPVIIGGLMSLVAGGGGGGSMPRAKVLVVDQDGGLMSDLIKGAGRGGDSPLDVETVSFEVGRDRIDRGDASALLIIPEGFTEAILNETPTTLGLIKNPSQTILPMIVEEMLEILSEGVFYLHRVLGEPIKAIAAGPADGAGFFGDLRMAALTVQINQRLSALEGMLFPPVLELETEVIRPEGQDDRPPVSFGSLMLPGILFMALLFIAQSMSDDLWREKNQGTLRRLASAPRRTVSFLGGKLVAGGVLMSCIGLAGFILGIYAFDLPWSALPSSVCWLGFSGMVMLCYFLLLQTLASSQRGGNIISMLFLFPLMMIGGTFFPFEAMPGWMQAVGAWTPNGQAVLQLKHMFSGTVDIKSLSAAIGSIGIPALCAFALTARSVRGSFLAK